MNDTTDRAEKLAAFRSIHTIEPVDAEHELFGRIHRCATCAIRVHWITRAWRHDSDEIVALLQEEYGGAWGFPKDERKALAIERLAALVDDGEAIFDEPDTDRESMPEFNGAFR